MRQATAHPARPGLLEVFSWNSPVNTMLVPLAEWGFAACRNRGTYAQAHVISSDAEVRNELCLKASQ